MKEYIVTMADNGFVMRAGDCLSVYEQRHREDVPQKMLEDMLNELISGIINREHKEFKVKIEVISLVTDLCETEQ